MGRWASLAVRAVGEGIRGKLGGRRWRLAGILLLLVTMAGLTARDAVAGVIFVTHREQRVQSKEADDWGGGCSLQEEIYAANFDDNIAITRWRSDDNTPVFVRTGCRPGSGDDVLVLVTRGHYEMDDIPDDAFNPFGPTATPIITSHITIEAHGATLQNTGTEPYRAFSVGSAGHLTLKNAYVGGFVAHGGNGGQAGGGGGGMGAGGAIYVHAGGLSVEGCTFNGNGAIGGDGAHSTSGLTFGGGGGLGGDGVPREPFTMCQGGAGGGGARGHGGSVCIVDGITGRGGGDGGGTLRNGNGGGFACGGEGGVGNEDGEDAPCPDGGGGGGGLNTLTGSGDGGRGGYGGGIVAIQDDPSAPSSFSLWNTIFAGNGPRECSIAGTGMTTSFAGNLIQDNDASSDPHPFDADWSGCGGVMTDEDPALGSLQENQGPTPTMVLFKNTLAWDSGDAGVGLPSDQRGQARPIGAYDIGVFEVCLIGPEQAPCLIVDDIAPQDEAYLTLLVSPEGTGTTSPGAGTPRRMRINSVVGIAAFPAPGYRFVSWTGDVIHPNSAFTAVIMDTDKTVTANFELKPDFTFSAVAPLTVAVGGTGTGTVTVNANAVFNEVVTLSSTGVPAGLSPTLNPASVTPVARGSASSQLRVAARLSMLSGRYSFSVIGSSASAQHTVPVAVNVVLSPQGVSQVIGGLVDLGCIDSAGVGNAFRVKLAQAQAAIDAGDTQTAINLLMALHQQLQAQAGKHLKTTCTEGGNTFNPVAVLIDHVTQLLQSLGASANLMPNPVLGSVASSANLETEGATVSLLIGSKTVVASATTDATGFYVFPKTSALKLGVDYTVRVSLPKGYRSAIPATSAFWWNATMVTVPKFILK